MSLTLLATLITSVGRGLAEQFISSDTAKSWLSFGFNIFEQGTAVEDRLRQAIDMFEEKQAEARERGEVWEVTDEEFAAVRARITGRDDAWSKI